MGVDVIEALKKDDDKKRVQALVDRDIATQAENILNDLGMTPTTAINIFYRQVIAQQRFPMEIESANEIKKLQKLAKRIPLTKLNNTTEVEDWLLNEEEY